MSGTSLARSQLIPRRGHWLLLSCALGLGLPNQMAAQRLEARLGVQFSSALVHDRGASQVLTQMLPATYNGPVTLKLNPAPVASVGLVRDISSRTALELMGSVAASRLSATTQDAEWQTQDVSMATLVVTMRYAYWSRANLHGGLGMTRFMSEATGIFSEGSNMLPVLELGTSTSLPVGALAVRAGARLQAHTFKTPALRRDGASGGRVVRLLIQFGIGG